MSTGSHRAAVIEERPDVHEVRAKIVFARDGKIGLARTRGRR